MNFNRTLIRIVLPILLGLFLLVTAFTGGYLARPFLEGTPEHGYPLLQKALTILSQNGLKELPAAKPLEYGLVRGALQAYNDPYTVFVEPAQAELQSNQLEGKFGGIGARLERDPQGYIVVLPFPDSPAAAGGISEGERLLAVGEIAFAANAAIDDVQAALRGPVGTRVTVTVAPPPDYPTRQVAVKRQEIAIPSTTWNLFPGRCHAGSHSGEYHCGYHNRRDPESCHRFAEPRRLTRLALDLRNNGGGLLEAGVDVARLFLKDGIVITQQYKDKDPQVFRVTKAGPLVDIPLVVLVNHNTASAAEIIAGALQSQGRAALVGTTTFGKDTIQLVFDLEDGSSLHVTSAHWWLPGREGGLGGEGLTPDWPVQEDANNPQAIFNAALEALKK